MQGWQRAGAAAAAAGGTPAATPHHRRMSQPKLSQRALPSALHRRVQAGRVPHTPNAQLPAAAGLHGVPPDRPSARFHAWCAPASGRHGAGSAAGRERGCLHGVAPPETGIRLLGVACSSMARLQPPRRRHAAGQQGKGVARAKCASCLRACDLRAIAQRPSSLQARPQPLRVPASPCLPRLASGQPRLPSIGSPSSLGVIVP